MKIILILFIIISNINDGDNNRNVIKVDVNEYDVSNVNMDSYTYYNNYLYYQNDVDKIFSINLPESIINYYDIANGEYGHLLNGKGRGPQEVSFLNLINFSEKYVYISDSNQMKYLLYDKKTNEYVKEVKTKNFSPFISIIDSLIFISDMPFSSDAFIYDEDLNEVGNISLPFDYETTGLFKNTGQIVYLNNEYYYFFDRYCFFRGIKTGKDMVFPIINKRYDKYDEVVKVANQGNTIKNPYKFNSNIIYNENGMIGVKYFDPYEYTFMFDLFKTSGEYIGSINYLDTANQFEKKFGSIAIGSKKIQNQYHVLLDESGNLIIIDMVKAILEAQ